MTFRYNSYSSKREAQPQLKMCHFKQNIQRHISQSNRENTSGDRSTRRATADSLWRSRRCVARRVGKSSQRAWTYGASRPTALNSIVYPEFTGADRRVIA